MFAPKGTKARYRATTLILLMPWPAVTLTCLRLLIFLVTAQILQGAWLVHENSTSAANVGVDNRTSDPASGD